MIGQYKSGKMSLVVPEKFQHILRVMNTNIDGRRKIMFAMTSIKGEQIECISSCDWRGGD